MYRFTDLFYGQVSFSLFVRVVHLMWFYGLLIAFDVLLSSYDSFTCSFAELCICFDCLLMFLRMLLRLFVLLIRND